MAEILSPSSRNRDLGIKAERYLKTKVREYWIIDPAENKIEVWRNRNTEWLKESGTVLESQPPSWSGLKQDDCKQCRASQAQLSNKENIMKKVSVWLFLIVLISVPVSAKDRDKKVKKGRDSVKEEQAEAVGSAGNQFDAFGQSMQNSMIDMVRMMYKAVFTEYSKKENADLIASYYKNLYDSLIEKGFTKEEAMRIILSTGIPSISGK